MAKRADVEIATLFKLKVEVVDLQVVQRHIAVIDAPTMGPEQRSPFARLPFDDKHHIINQTIVIIVEVEGVGHLVGHIINGTFQQGELAVCTLVIVVAKRIAHRVIWHVVFFRIVVLV